MLTQSTQTSDVDARPGLLTISDTAEELNTTERHVRRLIFEGRLRKTKIGKYVRVHPDDLAAFIEAGRS